MRIIARKPVAAFGRRHPAAAAPLQLWWKRVERAEWKNFADVKAEFSSADLVGDNRVVFNIGGNKFRLVARISYEPHYRVLIKFIGTHADYDRIDARTVEWTI